jgi:hypothetical protein
MTRVILLDPQPPTSGQILRYIIRFAFLLLLCIILMDVVTMMLGAENFLFNLLNTHLWPFARYILLIGGITAYPAMHPQLTAMASLYTLLMLWPISYFRYYMLAIRSEYEQNLSETGSTAAPAYDSWFVSGLSLLVLATLLRIYPIAYADSITSHIYLLGRMALVLWCVTGAFVAISVGMRLRRRWRELNPQAVAEEEQKRKERAKKKAKKPDLKVVSSQPAKPTPGNRPILVALVAELIQFCGQENRAPTAAELAGRLAPLLRAAQLTGSAPLSPIELEELCRKALDLFAGKRLSSLKDVKAATSLFNRPKSGAIDAIVAELDTRLNH